MQIVKEIRQHKWMLPAVLPVLILYKLTKLRFWLGIGPIATPDKFQFADGLPKTRSGKIMRRLLTKIAAGRIDELGDTSTLADPSVVDVLAGERQ